MQGLASKDRVTTEDLSLDSNTTSEIMALDEEGNEEEITVEYAGLVDHINGEFQRSKDKRFNDEQRWLECYRNYRGLYGPDTQFTDTEKSQAFIKITKTKVLAAVAQIQEVLFSTNKFPIGVEATPVPVGVEDAVHFDPKAPENKEELRSSVSRPSILKALGPLEDKLKPVIEKVQTGAGTSPTSFTFEPAREAAKNMEKLIHDQLDESEASKELRSLSFEMPLFGTGVFKGPFAIDKEYPRWSEDGEYDPIIKTIPSTAAVSVWNIYPDADAISDKDAELMIERHCMSKSALRALKKRPYFRKDAIEDLILQGPNYVKEYWEDDLRDYNNDSTTNRWEVLEFWGTIDKQLADESGWEIPKEYKDYDEIQVNVWISGDTIIRMVLNPFTPSRIPYYAVPYELNPYSYFGVGVAENMIDTQIVMNGFMRLAIDNAALSSNLIFEIDEGALSPGQDMKMYPGKVIKRNSGPVGQAVFSHKFQNVTNECLMMFDKARQLADEATGMPSYAHGMSGIQSTGRTAAGMSMLMGAAAQNIKQVVKNIDDYLLAPLGKALFAFNMQFNFDKKYIGDLDVVAKGTESLMRNEVRSQKLMQFFQLVLNPITAPYAKLDYILRELAESLDLDSDKTVNDPRQAAIQAQILGAMGMAQQPPGQPQEGQPGVGGSQGVPAPQTPSTPGEQGFSGAPQQSGPQEASPAAPPQGMAQ